MNNDDILESEYQWLINLAETDPSIADLLRRAEKQLKKTNDPAQFKSWMSSEYSKTDYAINNYASAEEAQVYKNDPSKVGEYNRMVDLKRQNIESVASRYGVTLDQPTLDSLAMQATDNAWTDLQIQSQLRGMVDQQVAGGADAIGDAGSYQTELQNWLSLNGMRLDQGAVGKYVGRMTFGEQSLEDVKQEIRTTYMAGAFPAWADRINAGFDVSDIASPYRASAAALLEMDENDIALDDPLLQRGLQGLDSEGKPRIMPLYEFQQMVRQDSRWQTTDNAYKSYTDVGQDLLRMFGFR